MCSVLMKQSILAVFCILLASAAHSASAQVAPAAQRSGLSVTAGGEFSAFQPDYAGNGVAETSPNRLFGIGAYVDARFNRWVQIEAEGRWLHFNQYYFGDPPTGNGENSYLIGPRIPIHDFHGWTPYGKVLFGWGSGAFLTGRAGNIAYGGGVDYRLTRKITLRPFDFEYQQWHVTPTLWPYGASAGISYKIF